MTLTINDLGYISGDFFTNSSGRPVAKPSLSHLLKNRFFPRNGLNKYLDASASKLDFRLSEQKVSESHFRYHDKLRLARPATDIEPFVVAERLNLNNSKKHRTEAGS
jgi:hypothetical protein